MKTIATLCLVLICSGLSFAQKTEWVKTITDQASEISEDHKVILDQSGNHYVTLNFKKVIRFGKDVILKAKSQTGEYDAVIAKLDAEGKLIKWTAQISSYGNVLIKSIDLDLAGNPIVVGSFEQETDFGGSTLTPKGKTGFFIAKYTASGDLLWVKYGGSYTTVYPNSADAKAVSTDGAGNIFISATAIGMYDDWKDDPSLENELRYRGKVYFEDQETDEIYTGNGTMLLKLNAEGDLLWQKMVKLGLTIWDMDTDKSGNLYCTGNFINVSNFLGEEVLSNGLSDIFVAKVDPSGELSWIKQFGCGVPYKIGSASADLDMGTQIAVDGQSNVYFGGLHFDNAQFDGINQHSDAKIGTTEVGTFFISKLDANGNVAWVRSAESKMGSRLSGLTCDQAGNSYASALLLFKKGNFAGDNARGAFIAKLDTDGNLQWSDDADDRKGSVKIKVSQPGSLALSADESYLLQTGNAVETETSSGFQTSTTSTSAIIAISKVKTN